MIRNKCLFYGRVGTEPEMQYLQSGRAMLKFRFAINEPFPDNSGKWNDNTNWMNVVAFGDTAERLSTKIESGTLLMFEGKYRNREYEQEGVKKNYVQFEVMVYEVVKDGKYSDGSSNASAPSSNYTPTDDAEDDFPF